MDRPHVWVQLLSIAGAVALGCLTAVPPLYALGAIVLIAAPTDALSVIRGAIGKSQ